VERGKTNVSQFNNITLDQADFTQNISKISTNITIILTDAGEVVKMLGRRRVYWLG